MIYIADTRDFWIKEPAIVTLGKFDGRHRGHQKLLRTMMERKEKTGYATAVFTFSPDWSAGRAGLPQTVITTSQERRANMEKMGIDYLVEYPFTEETRHMKPQDFVREMLAGRMNAKEIVVGPDCSFGYQGAGDVKLLEEMAEKLGFQVYVIQKEQDLQRDISSTYIREELDQGNVEKANALLGEPYAIHGTVVHGNHMGGSVLGFPTANLLPPTIKRLPRFGVYASQVVLEGKIYQGVTNIGRKPTVEGENPVGVETFLFDWSGDIYGKSIEVQLLSFIRPEKKFGSLEELKEQIARDQSAAAAYFQEK